jgi:preprotein translocase subunit YajC
MIRPQNKKAKETQAMLDAMKKGDKVVTIGGIHGTVSQVKEKTVIVKVDDGTKLEFNRSAIATVNNAEGISVKKESKKEKAAESIEEAKAEEEAAVKDSEEK